MLSHWSSWQRSDTTDTERVRTFMATSRHLRKRVFPVIEIYNFVWPLECYQFALGSGFSELFSSTLSCALNLPVEQWSRINIFFSTAITRHNCGGSYSRLEISFSPPNPVGHTLRVLLCRR
uniref:AlNc14C911G12623 protein n=1 Tax=Albugo laibachii Nc14 TaxID=890382 RepID=F0X294_9STRA|nr:AlNc14C911G12623 [Albugo laibachii Nc14]|eukprot:CCA27974.1 AlNc14C911G12623 [Albugo laibachii Nc14]